MICLSVKAIRARPRQVVRGADGEIYVVDESICANLFDWK